MSRYTRCQVKDRKTDRQTHTHRHTHTHQESYLSPGQKTKGNKKQKEKSKLGLDRREEGTPALHWGLSINVIQKGRLKKKKIGFR